jgi:hypothetical protein
MKKRGQISIELVITVGFAFLIIIPLALLLYQHTSQTRDEISNNQAGLIARKITDTANSVYYLGYPSTVTLKVYMPETIETITLNSRSIIFLLQDDIEIVSTANVNLTGNIPARSGLMHIRIAALEDIVNITEDVD